MVRVTLDMSDELHSLFVETAQAEGVDFQEAVRRAGSVLATVTDIQRRGGRMLAEVDGATYEVDWIA